MGLFRVIQGEKMNAAALTNNTDISVLAPFPPFTAYDLEVLGKAFAQAHSTGRNTSDENIQDFGRLFNHSDCPPFIMQTAQAAIASLRSDNSDWDESKEQAFLGAAARVMQAYREAILTQDQTRPSGYKIEPKFYGFLTATYPGFEQKIINYGINTLRETLFDSLAKSKKGNLSDENIGRYQQLSGLIQHLKQQFSDQVQETPTFEAVEQAVLAYQLQYSEVREQLQALSEEALARELLYCFAVMQGQYITDESKLNMNNDGVIAANLSTKLALIDKLEAIASDSYTAQPEQILALAQNANPNYLEEAEARWMPFPANLKDYACKSIVQGIFANLDSLVNLDDKALAINSLLRVREWLSENTLPDLSRVLQSIAAQPDSRIAAYLEALAYTLQTIPNEKLAAHLSHFDNIEGLAQGRLLANSVLRLNDSENIEALSPFDGKCNLNTVTDKLFVCLDRREVVYAGEDNSRIDPGNGGDVNQEADLSRIEREIKSKLGLAEDFPRPFLYVTQKMAQVFPRVFFTQLQSIDQLNLFTGGQAGEPAPYRFTKDARGNVHVTCGASTLYLRSAKNLDLYLPVDLHDEFDYAYVDAAQPAYKLEAYKISGYDKDIAQAILFEAQDSPAFINAYTAIEKRFTLETRYELATDLFSWVNEQGMEAIHELKAVTNPIKRIIVKFYRAESQADSVAECMQDLYKMQLAHSELLAKYPELQEVISKIEINMAAANPKAAREVISSRLIADIKYAPEREQVEALISNYQAKLEKDESFRKLMFTPAKTSRYVAPIHIDGEVKILPSTQSHSNIIKAAKDAILLKSKRPGTTPLKVSEKALLALERKKPWASWKFWGTVGLALLGGLL
ncbi:MAG: hypothetical protein K0Q57_937 [Gammaproteobacteria bacterium]|nr:hypothetical protein [Gammaproteobacteria bacterium]